MSITIRIASFTFSLRFGRRPRPIAKPEAEISWLKQARDMGA